MAELEIHHETEHEHDPFGKKIGIVAAIIGVLLAVDTIQSHRAHTGAVIARTEANDEWAYYQAKSIKRVQYGIAAEEAQQNPASAAVAEKFGKEQERYAEQEKEIEKEARHKDDETRLQEARALRFDIGEGMLELGLVLCSLYFIARRRLFPLVGAVAAVVGTVVGATGWLVR